MWPPGRGMRVRACVSCTRVCLSALLSFFALYTLACLSLSLQRPPLPFPHRPAPDIPVEPSNMALMLADQRQKDLLGHLPPEQRQAISEAWQRGRLAMEEELEQSKQAEAERAKVKSFC